MDYICSETEATQLLSRAGELWNVVWDYEYSRCHTLLSSILTTIIFIYGHDREKKITYETLTSTSGLKISSIYETNWLYYFIDSKSYVPNIESLVVIFLLVNNKKLKQYLKSLQLPTPLQKKENTCQKHLE